MLLGMELLGLTFVVRQFTFHLHGIVGLLATGSLWIHLQRQSSWSRWALLGGWGLHSVLTAWPWIRSGWRLRREGWPRVQVDAIHGVLQLQVPVPRDWVYIPGQSIRLWCRDLGFRARWRLVPFTIANRTHDDHQDTLYLYTRPLSYGPMMHLEPSRHPRTAAFHALVLGPHGRPHDLRRFGTVILIASDVGIAEVLPYVQTLIDASRRRDAMVRRIHLIWQVADYGK